MSDANLAGDAWAEPVDLTPLLDRLRAGGIDVQVARVQSDAPRVLDCATCEGPQPVTGTTRVLGGEHLRLACGHIVRDWTGGL